MKKESLAKQLEKLLNAVDAVINLETDKDGRVDASGEEFHDLIVQFDKTVKRMASILKKVKK